MSEFNYKNQSVTLNYFEGPKNGSPVLLIHGNMGRWQNFSPVIEKLSKTHSVFAVDLRGHGKSSHVANSYFLKIHLQDIILFIKEQIKEPVTLVGYSLGGMIALMCAAYYPELVQQLIVLEPPLTLQTLTPIIEAQKDFVDRLVHYRQTNQIEQLYKEVNDDAVSLGMSLCDLSIFDITVNYPEKMVEGFDIEQLMPLIKCPSLLLHGEMSLGGMISDDDIKQLKQLAPQFRVKQLPGLGHSLLADNRVLAMLVNEVAALELEPV